MFHYPTRTIKYILSHEERAQLGTIAQKVKGIDPGGEKDLDQIEAKLRQELSTEELGLLIDVKRKIQSAMADSDSDSAFGQLIEKMGLTSVDQSRRTAQISKILMDVASKTELTSTGVRLEKNMSDNYAKIIGDSQDQGLVKKVVHIFSVFEIKKFEGGMRSRIIEKLKAGKLKNEELFEYVSNFAQKNSFTNPAQLFEYWLDFSEVFGENLEKAKILGQSCERLIAKWGEAGIKTLHDMMPLFQGRLDRMLRWAQTLETFINERNENQAANYGSDDIPQVGYLMGDENQTGYNVSQAISSMSMPDQDFVVAKLLSYLKERLIHKGIRGAVRNISDVSEAFCSTINVFMDSKGHLDEDLCNQALEKIIDFLVLLEELRVSSTQKSGYLMRLKSNNIKSLADLGVFIENIRVETSNDRN